MSRINFWDAHALSTAGHEIHVVTNAPDVESPFRIREDFYLDQPGDAPRSDVVVHAPSSERQRYIPYSNPFVSKLAGTATRVATQIGADLIYAYYLEPYGVAARLASAWTGVPFGLRHAGSDVRHLARHEALGTVFDRLARDAAFWLDVSEGMRRGWQARGVPPERFYSIGRYSLPTHYFNPDAEPMKLARLGHFDSDSPTIGLYGKQGESKGTYDLLHAYAIARERAGRGNLVIVSSGPPKGLERLQRMAAELGIDVLLLPFMPHWKVPTFIAACDAVAFLERGFPVDIHRPAVPREILACGRCLILSSEVAAYQTYADELRDGENCLIADPRNEPDLVGIVQSVLESPETARKIGHAGYQQLSLRVEDWYEYTDSLVRTFERIHAETQERAALMSAAEMQAAIARVSVDEAFRKWFSFAPDEALDKYKLTEEERSAIRSIDRKMMRLFAESLRSKRRWKVLEFYQLCMTVHRDDVTRYFDRYYDLHPAQPNTTNIDLILGFGRYLAECLAAEPSVADYAADLCRYEFTLAEFQFTPLSAEDPLTVPQEELPARPVVAPGVRCVRFSYDIPALAEQVERGSAPATAARAETHVVFRTVPRRRMPEAFKIGAGTATLLTLCNGESGVEEIKRRMAESLGPVDSAIDGTLQRLRATGLIRMGKT